MSKQFGFVMGLVFMVAASATSAANFNGSFEGENPFEGWQGSADAVNLGTLFQRTGSLPTLQGVSLLPTAGVSMAMFESFEDDSSIWLDFGGPGTVRLEVAFVSNESLGDPFPMNSRATIVLDGDVLFEAETFALGFGANGGGNFIDWMTIVAPVMNGSRLTLRIELLSGSGIPSQFLVDGVSFTPVPLPASLPLFGVTALCLAGLSRRSRT